MNRNVGLTRKTGLTPVPFPSGSTRLDRNVPLGRITGSGAGKSPAAGRAPRKATGFSRAVKLAVRTRAGDGDPDNARCEATGVWLGRYGGEIQHRRARGMGGTSDPVTNSIVNAVLLSKEAHRLAESRDEGMNAEGFWLRNGEDPALTPILLHSQNGSGMTVYLGEDGLYHEQAPGEVAA